MVFKAVSEKIDFDAVKESTTLTGEALAKKQARDKELEAIIKGEDNRTLLVIGPCSSDNEDAVLDYAHRLAKLQEEVKDKVMYEIVLAKFTQNPDLKEKLLATGDEHLEEGNTWGDTIWGTVDGVGENRLGKILMRVRDELNET